MKASTFHDQMAMLGNNFNLKENAIEGKLEYVWQVFSATDDDLFIKACRVILENDDRFPTIKRLREVVGDCSALFTPIRKTVDCPLCEGSGFISTVKDCGPHSKGVEGRYWADYAFRCSCANGATLCERIPAWEERWLNKGHLLRDEWYERFMKWRWPVQNQEERKVAPRVADNLCVTIY